ncbi:MAG TPA: hypothetical protein VF928_06290 [Usitatibacteraceae bacterium]
MCNIPLLYGLLIAAESALIAALIPLGLAVGLGTNPFTSPLAPALVIVALVFFGVAQTAIGAAIAACGPCTGTGACGTTGELLRAFLAGIFLSITALVAAGIIVLAVSALPWAGSIAVGIVAIACAAIIPLVPLAAINLGRLEVCRTGLAGSVAATVVVVLAILVAVIAIPIAVIAGGAVLPPGVG